MVEGLFGLKEISKNTQNQIILPVEFREILEEEATKGKYYVYMEEERSLLFSTLEELMNDLRQAEKGIMETFTKNAFTVFSKNMVIVNMGSDGRITLSKEMMSKAGIHKNDKKVICAGVNNKIEIWSVARYKEQIKDREVEFTSQKRVFENEVFKFNLSDRSSTQGNGTADGSDK
jgi:DNA-binding transcriptional regulator/RsmH inhibitor MraZ